MQQIESVTKQLVDKNSLSRDEFGRGDYNPLHIYMSIEINKGLLEYLIPYNPLFITPYFFNFSIIKSATFLPESIIPPKIGPMRGVPATAEDAIPQT